MQSCRLRKGLKFGWIIIWLIILAILTSCSGAGSAGADKGGEIKISPQGTNIKQDELTISVPAGAVESELVFTVRSHKENQTLPSEIAYYSPVYTLAGDFGSLGERVAISFDIPEEVLEGAELSPADLEKSFFIEVIEEYDPEKGTPSAFLGFDLPVEVDLEEKTVTGWIDLDQLQAAFLSRGKVFAPAADQPAKGALPASIAVRMGRTWTLAKTLESADGNFQVVFRENLDLNALDSLLSHLEDTKVRIEELGMSFSRRTSYPISVNVRDTGGKDGDFTGSYFVNSMELNINSRFFKPDVFSQYQDLALATAGHELFHLAQALYYPQDYSYLTNFQNYEWLDEASAVWFESVVLNNSSWFPNVAESNKDFTNTPLNYPSDPAAEHGYGASWYFRYLTGPGGLDISVIPRVYQLAYKSGVSNSPGSALENALLEYGTTSADLWPRFLETYFLHPGVLAPNLDTRSMFDRVMLSVGKDEETQDSLLMFEPGSGSIKAFEKYQPIVIPGRPEEKESYPQMKFAISLEELVGKPIQIGINNTNDPAGKFLEQGSLHVDGISEGIFTGIEVFGLPDASLSSPEYLGSPPIEIKEFGLKGKYKSVILILSNADPTVGGVSAESFQLSFSYQPFELCTQYTGILKVATADFATSPCTDFIHCGGYTESSAPSSNAMGDAGDAGGGGDCSQAPPICYDQATIVDIVEYLQPGTRIPFQISLVEVDGVDQYGTSLELKWQKNQNAQNVQVALWNSAGYDSKTDLGQYDAKLQTIDHIISYGQGQIALSGTLGEDDGSGSFVLFHPEAGDFTTGTWTARCVE